MVLPNAVLLISFLAVAVWGQSAPVALTSLKPHKLKVEQARFFSPL
jgi:hypothetical protein